VGEILEATTKAADAPDVEAGFWDAKFAGVTRKFIEGGDYGNGERYVWEFQLLDDDGADLYDKGEPVIVDGLTSLSFNTTSKTKPKALRYMAAILSEAEFATWVAGEAKLDATELVGRLVQVEIFTRDNGWPSISNVLAKRARRAARSANVEAATAADELFRA
jgi:hypothetical protein